MILSPSCYYHEKQHMVMKNYYWDACFVRDNARVIGHARFRNTIWVFTISRRTLDVHGDILSEKSRPSITLWPRNGRRGALVETRFSFVRRKNVFAASTESPYLNMHSTRKKVKNYETIIKTGVSKMYIEKCAYICLYVCTHVCINICKCVHIFSNALY